MAKLFFTLYLMVLASFIVFAVYVSSISFFGELIGEGSIIEEKVSKGTFMLLNNSLEGLDESQVERQLQQHKELFGNELKLIEMSSVNFTAGQRQALKNGKVITIEENNIHYINAKISQESLVDIEEEVTILYFQRPNTSQIWRAHLDYKWDLKINETQISVNVLGGKFLEGMMFLIQKNLTSIDVPKRSNFLKNLQINFILPLEVTNFEKISTVLKNKEITESLLQQGKIVNITQGNHVATFVQRIPNSENLLQVGPVEIPWYIRNFPLLFIVAFILAFATTLFLWLWPLWSSLTKIKKASDEFGAGSYDARIIQNKLSPIKKISQAFNVMAEQTQRSIRSQKELTSAVSHELRTPVARMRFALEMLNSSDNEEDKTRYADAINEDINELDLLLEELLSYARFDQNNLDLNPSLVKLIPWLDHSMQKLLPLANDKTLVYMVKDIEDDETNHFEPRLMSRVLDNLVQNALRYAKSKVKVSLKRTDDHYLLMVEDDGEGIPEDKREHIFDAFSRIDASRDRASGGFGLGLAIVDRIMKSHQGSVSIHSSYLGGARFEVRLPRK